MVTLCAAGPDPTAFSILLEMGPDAEFDEPPLQLLMSSVSKLKYRILLNIAPDKFLSSKQTHYVAVFVYIYFLSRRVRRQGRHCAHIAADRINESRTDAGADLTNRQGPVFWRAFHHGIVA